jgi:cysteine desulfuration protein SufE
MTGARASEPEQRPLPEALADIAEDFRAMSVNDRLQLLLEFSDELPPLPARYAGHAELMEQVEECQSPVFLAVEVEEGDSADDGKRPTHQAVRLFFDAPPSAPTTRGFAGILHAGLDGIAPEELLAVPDDAPYRFGLGDAVSPLRLRGMVSMLGRIKRQVRAKTAA